MGIDPRRYLRETLAKTLGGEKNLIELLPETLAERLEADAKVNASVAA